MRTISGSRSFNNMRTISGSLDNIQGIDYYLFYFLMN